MEVLNHVTEISRKLSLVHTVVRNSTIESYIYKELEELGNLHSIGKLANLLFSSDVPYNFTINEIQYCGLTVDNIYTNKGGKNTADIIFSETFDEPWLNTW